LEKTVYTDGKKDFIPFLAILFVFCILFSAQKICSYDIWWHLKTGEWIWHNKGIPHVDPFSYTFHGAEWIDFEWLFQTIIYPMYQLGGFAGLIIFKVIVITFTFVILYFTCRQVDRGKPLLTIAVLFLILLVARMRFLVRPQILFLWFLALYGYLLTLYRADKISTREMILCFLPLHVLWANFHSSFLMGVILVGVHAAGRFIPLAVSHSRDLKPVLRDRRLRGLSALCCLLVAASLLTPYTYKVFLIHVKTAGSGEILKGIAEWVPVDIRLLGLLIHDPTVWFRALFLIGAVSFLIQRDNLKRVEDVLIFTFFAYLAFKHVRFGGAFAIVVAPVVVNNLSGFQWQMRGWRLVRLLPLVVLIVFAVRDVGALIQVKRLGLGVWSNYPRGTVNFLNQHRVKGRIFNSYGLGGYIIWHLYPSIPVFIDGRTATIYDQDFFWLYNLAESRRKDVWEKIVERYGIDMVLLLDNREEGYAKLSYWLDEDENWRLVAFDDNATLYLRKGVTFDDLIEQYGFRCLKPSDLSMDYAKSRNEDIEYLATLHQELQVACSRFPGDFYPFYYLGIYHQIYGTQEHLQEAARALRKAVDNRPDLARGYYELGFTLMKLERYDEAIAALKTAIKAVPNLPQDAYYYLGTSLFHAGGVTGAIKYLEEYRKRAGTATRVEAYKLLGRGYLQKYEFRAAVSCFERVSYLEDPTWETFTQRGLAHFGLDELDEAREYFELAMALKPDVLQVLYNLAVTYEKLGAREKAARLFEKASRIQPTTKEEGVWVEKARERLR